MPLLYTKEYLAVFTIILIIIFFHVFTISSNQNTSVFKQITSVFKQNTVVDKNEDIQGANSIGSDVKYQEMMCLLKRSSVDNSIRCSSIPGLSPRPQNTEEPKKFLNF